MSAHARSTNRKEFNGAGLWEEKATNIFDFSSHFQYFFNVVWFKGKFFSMKSYWIDFLFAVFSLFRIYCEREMEGKLINFSWFLFYKEGFPFQIFYIFDTWFGRKEMFESLQRIKFSQAQSSHETVNNSKVWLTVL